MEPMEPVAAAAAAARMPAEILRRLLLVRGLDFLAMLPRSVGRASKDWEKEGVNVLHCRRAGCDSVFPDARTARTHELDAHVSVDSKCQINDCGVCPKQRRRHFMDVHVEPDLVCHWCRVGFANSPLKLKCHYLGLSPDATRATDPLLEYSIEQLSRHPCKLIVAIQAMTEGKLPQFLALCEAATEAEALDFLARRLTTDVQVQEFRAKMVELFSGCTKLKKKEMTFTSSIITESRPPSSGSEPVITRKKRMNRPASTTLSLDDSAETTTTWPSSSSSTAMRPARVKAPKRTRLGSVEESSLFEQPDVPLSVALTLNFQIPPEEVDLSFLDEDDTPPPLPAHLCSGDQILDEYRRWSGYEEE